MAQGRAARARSDAPGEEALSSIHSPVTPAPRERSLQRARLQSSVAAWEEVVSLTLPARGPSRSVSEKSDRRLDLQTRRVAVGRQPDCPLTDGVDDARVTHAIAHRPDVGGAQRDDTRSAA